MNFDLTALVRPNLRRMQPYSSARDEFVGQAAVMLDANENALGAPVGEAAQQLNRYPDPLQRALKQEVAALKGVRPEHVFFGNGSDEVIDLLVRLVCVPGQDELLVTAPTYGLYEVAAALNDVQVTRLPLTPEFQLPADLPARLAASGAKLLFLCSPNNPTGNALEAAAVEAALRSFRGLVVVDEAYADFAAGPSWVGRLAEFPNLVVLQTFSKNWGLAGLRLGTAYASAELVAYLTRIKPPYNVSTLTQELALQALRRADQVADARAAILAGRAALAARLPQVPAVAHVFPSEANFLLVRFHPPAGEVYEHLLARGIVVRNRSTQPGCANCLRLTVGTAAENDALLHALAAFPVPAASSTSPAPAPESAPAESVPSVKSASIRD